MSQENQPIADMDLLSQAPRCCSGGLSVQRTFPPLVRRVLCRGCGRVLVESRAPETKKGP